MGVIKFTKPMCLKTEDTLWLSRVSSLSLLQTGEEVSPAYKITDVRLWELSQVVDSSVIHTEKDF